MDAKLGVLSQATLTAALSAMPSRGWGLEDAKRGLALQQAQFDNVQANFQTVAMRRAAFQESFARTMEERFQQGVLSARTRNTVARMADGGFIVDSIEYSDHPYANYLKAEGAFLRLDASGNPQGVVYAHTGFSDENRIDILGYSEDVDPDIAAHSISLARNFEMLLMSGVIPGATVGALSPRAPKSTGNVVPEPNFRVPGPPLSAGVPRINLGRDFYIREGSEITSVEVIARGRGIREVRGLVREFGGRAQGWSKRKGISEVVIPDGGISYKEVHWYQNSSVGKIK